MRTTKHSINMTCRNFSFFKYGLLFIRTLTEFLIKTYKTVIVITKLVINFYAWTFLIDFWLFLFWLVCVSCRFSKKVFPVQTTVQCKPHFLFRVNKAVGLLKY
jgi:hypothetical protein